MPLRSVLVSALLLATGLAPAKAIPPVPAAQGVSVSPEAAKLNTQGLAHLNKKEYDAAIPLFRKALELQPDYPDALNNLGKALDATGKDDEAVADFDRALKLGA